MTIHVATRRTALVAVACATALGAAVVRGAPADEVLSARVAEVTAGRTLRLDLGFEAGVRERQVFDLFREAKVWSLPLSGGAGKIKVQHEYVARAVVIRVDARGAEARIFEEKGKVEKGQFAVLNAKAKAPDQPPIVRSHSPKGAAAQAAWRAEVELKLEVDLDPGKRAFYEWRTPAGGSFTRGLEVAPGTFRTATPENGWIAPYAKKKCDVYVSVTDTAGKTARHVIPLEATGPAGSRGAQARVRRVLYRPVRFEGIRDVAFDRRNNVFWLDGSTGLTGDQFLFGTSADGAPLGKAKVVDHNFSALAVSDASFYFLDAKTGCVLRYARGGSLEQMLASEAQRVGASGEGNGRFKDPVDIALAPDGTLYVLDAGQRCVQRFDADGAFLDSFGRPGEGERELKAPVALAVSEDGNVHVLDNGRKRVVVYRNARAEREIEIGKPNEEFTGLAVDPYGATIHVLERTQGIVKRFSDDGVQLGASAGGSDEKNVAVLKKAARLRVDATRVLHVIDREGASLARLDENGDFVARTGGEACRISTDVKLTASADGDVVVLDREARCVFRLDQRGWILARASSEGSAPGQLKTPVGVGVDGDGQVFTIDAKKSEIAKFQARGGAHLRSWPCDAYFVNIRNLQMSSSRERLIVLQDREEKSIAVVDPQTGTVEAYYPPSSSVYENPVVATFVGRFDPNAPKDEQGYFWVVDKKGERVQWLSWSSRTPVELTKSFEKVTGIAATVSGLILLCDQEAKTIEIMNGNNGQALGAVKDDQLSEPVDVGADDLGRIYVFDKGKDGRIFELGE